MNRQERSRTWYADHIPQPHVNGYLPAINDEVDGVIWEGAATFASAMEAMSFADVVLGEYRVGRVNLIGPSGQVIR